MENARMVLHHQKQNTSITLHKTANHHHHLHVQDYEPDFKEIKQ
jgi:hypothetical protein